jgi:5'-nucleotidase
MKLHQMKLVPALALMALAVAAPGASARGGDDGHRHAKKPKPPVELQLLGINDFHGNLESTGLSTTVGPPVPPSTSNRTTPSGGAEHLATALRQARAGHRHSMTVSAGDLIGASPLLSALFHDEPTIEAMNLIGLDLNSVGNHEFDEGATELLRMQRGGCHPVDGCADGDGFRGARFKFLAANVVVEATGRTLFPAYRIEKFEGIKVAFIGMTLEGTPDIVSPSGVAGLDFRDEAETVNALVPRLKRQGVEAFVVLMHEGGFQTAAAAWEYDTCKTTVSDPLNRIAAEMSPEVDVIVSGHTHTAYNCVLYGKRVTSASSNGRLFTEIDLQLDRRTRDIVATPAAQNRVVEQGVFAKALDITQLIAKYNQFAAPLRDRIVGSITATIPEITDDSGENAAGNLIADAQDAATASSTTGNAVAAFMNPGGVRTDAGFVYPASGAEGDGNVTYGESFNVQPFGNSLVTMTLTGAQLYEMLKQQWCGRGSRTVLLPSSSVEYTWSRALLPAPNTSCASASNPVTSFTIDGAPVVKGQSYRITVNSFLADGGDTFPVLRAGTERLGGAVDTDALEAYFKANSPLSPPALDRIDVAP